MLNETMLRKMFMQIFVLTGIIGHYPGFFGDILFQDRDNGFGIDFINHDAPGFAGFPVNKGKNLALMGIAAALGHIVFLPYEGFVNLNSTAIGAEMAALRPLGVLLREGLP